MKIWLLENGEKKGPFESYALRERIEVGEITAETLAWYQGAEDWCRIDEIPQFALLFTEKKEVKPPPIPVQEKSPREELKEAIAREVAKAPPLYMTRRLFARLFDTMLYMAMVVICFREKAFQALMADSMPQFLGVGIAYVILDGLMTHVWKASPGKLLLGLRVTGSLGHAIPLKGSIIRSLRAWILGLGMWLMIPFALIISWFMAKRFGYFLWDMPHRYRVVARPFSAMHVVVYILSVVTVEVALRFLLPQEVVAEMFRVLGAEGIMPQ